MNPLIEGSIHFLKVYVLGEVLPVNQILESDHSMFAQDRIWHRP
ncbi:hypothetical protein COLINT_02812 [Collinsella intestinalis DSM 13280]|uniref:Uncharacterized protein n=1 Tax=Collinsella intestinalis DSM 13280 TaxID=521003 RepID=C4F9S8_9ACTN|nr:hypothetical protein COLINT_02812 [Collinsella intestinalis DSM 13280]